MDTKYYNSQAAHAVEGGGDYPEKIDFFLKEVMTLYKSSGKKLQLLDVGCFDGSLGSRFLQYADVCGIELNETAVAAANKKNVKAIVGDVFKLPELFPGKKFDLVTAGDIIEHVFDTDLFLQTISKVLKPGGTLLLSTPNLLSLGRRIMAVCGKNPFCEYSSKSDGVNVGHIRYYTYDNLLAQLNDNGYVNIYITTDTVNIPIKIIDRLLININPRLGRELYARATIT